jgi:hypothetical protein
VPAIKHNIRDEMSLPHTSLIREVDDDEAALHARQEQLLL